MSVRAPLVALFAVSAACTASQESKAAPAPKPAPAADVALTLPPLGKVTPVTTLFVATGDKPPPDGAPPWSLTASDGSGLQMTRIDARAVVEGPLAFTELHLFFHNPEARTREGTFSITLPAHAAVSRFAMENNGQFMEAEVVEQQLARRAYEDFLHRRQDPALLEKAEGNRFSARVFPIAGNADKHLVISYSQEVTPGRYTLPLRGLAKAGRVDVRVQVRGKTGGIAEQTMSERNWKPDRDIVVDGTSVGAPMAIAAGELVATRMKLELANAAAPPASVTLLVDTSASRALGFAVQARAVHQLVDQLARAYGGGLPVQVIAFDQVTTPLYEGRADRIAGIEAALVERGALGASDLGQALRWLAAHAPKSRIVVVSDGVITAGARTDELPALARQLASRGVDRIDLALTGGIRDEQAAAAVARAGLAHTGAILDLDQGAAEVARRIGLAVQTQLPITVEGARWVFPHMIEGAQAGDEVTVFARRDPQARQLAVTIAGVRTVVSPVGVTPALLGRAFAGAEIAELEGKLARATGAVADALRTEIIRRSVAGRVVSSLTSMLVLESDADYARYGIDRSALADILAVGPSGVELTHRAPPPPAVEIARPQLAADKQPMAKKQPVARKQLDDERKEEKAKGDMAGALDPAGAERRDGNAAAASPGRAAGASIARNVQPADQVARGSASGGEAGAMDRDASPRAVVASEPAPSTARPRQPSTRTPEPAAPALDPAPMSRPRALRPQAPVEHRPLAPAPPPPPTAALRVDSEIAIDARVVREADDDGLAANRRKPALHGPLAEIEAALAAGRSDAALARARAWHSKEPGDVLALIGLGDALEARKDLDTAARVYGSIIDLYPARADFRRFAGERLERLGKAQRALIIDTYRRAVEQRPDHLTGHRMLAYALLRDGQYAAAFTAILAGIDQRYPDNRFAGAERVLAEDVGMIGAAYIAHGGKRAEVLGELARRRIALPTTPSTRFILYWETDANDVDFHIRDARGGHAWYSNKQLRSGGELYADITTGYGPECFAIPGKPTAGPYQLSINYYSQGPMGYGMGLLQIQTFDGQGNLRFEDRPYVIMTNQAFVDLGAYR